MVHETGDFQVHMLLDFYIFFICPLKGTILLGCCFISAKQAAIEGFAQN